VPDLDDLTAFAIANRHNLSGPVSHEQVVALADAWFPEVRFHERERFHPIDLPGMLTHALGAFQQLPPDEQDQLRIPFTTGVDQNGQPIRERFDPPVVFTSAGGTHVLGSGATAVDAVDDLNDLRRGGVITHGDSLTASHRLFGATTTVSGAADPAPGDPRIPRYQMVVRAELRILLEALKHELQLDDLPPALSGRGLPIDAIWEGFAVEGSLFARDVGDRPDPVPRRPAEFPRSAQRAVLRALITAYESDRDAQPEGIPEGWHFVTRAWEALTRYAFLDFSFVYAFNDYKDYGDAPFSNNHEGDVEGCCVVFERQILERYAAGSIGLADVVPHTVITAAHEEFQEIDSLKRLPIDHDRARDDLVVYVAPGSHGSYLTVGSHDILDFEDVAIDLPQMLPSWTVLVGLGTVGSSTLGILALGAVALGLAEHFIDAEDQTSDNGASIGPGPDPAPGGPRFGKQIEVTPLSNIITGLNIYQDTPEMRARLGVRGFPGKWGATDGLIDKSPPWKNKTARYFRRFLQSDNIAPTPVVD
jgi:hypothetical protein